DPDRLEGPFAGAELLDDRMVDGAGGLAVERGHDAVGPPGEEAAEDQVVLLGPPGPPPLLGLAAPGLRAGDDDHGAALRLVEHGTAAGHEYPHGATPEPPRLLARGPADDHREGERVPLRLVLEGLHVEPHRVPVLGRVLQQGDEILTVELVAR